MVTDQDIVDLKKVYERWQSFETVTEYGPLRGYVEHVGIAVRQMWREIIDPAIALVADSAKKTGDGIHAAEAPSPWHAFFYLRAQQQYAYLAGHPLGSENVDDNSGGEHLFFRGQRCASWEFKSSLRRKDSNTQAVEQRAVLALEEYFRYNFAKNADIAHNSALCFAQHYGIATDLADVSCDPDIAVWFATHPVGEMCPSGECEAIVQTVSWASQQEIAKIVFLLPPPFVRNVYEQRGLFIDTSSTGGTLTGKLSLQVSFPRETAGGEFRVVRGGRSLEVWPEPDADEKELVAWARTIAATCSSSEAIHDMVDAQRHTRGALPKYWLERQLYDFDKHVEAWLSILDWVLPATCVTARPVNPEPEPMRYGINSAKARELIRSNPSFFKAFVVASEGADFTNFKVLKAMLDLARKELAL
jgi:hypothetical protein